MATIEDTLERQHIVDPVSPRRTPERIAAPRRNALNGACIGLLYNGKPGGQSILAGIRQALADRFANVSFDYRFKAHASVGAPFIDAVQGVWDVAVIAVGDCGSCSSWAIRDATELEKRKIPTAVFISKPFAQMSRLWATQLDVPDLGIVVVDHPLAHLDTRVLETVFGADRVDEVIEILTADATRA